MLLVCIGFSHFIFPQENSQTITFSTVPNEKQKSLKPYYEALKTAEFGAPRFSIFEQLATHHIQKANTDSIMYYGDLYLKEIQNWDKPELEKKFHLTKAYHILANGCKFNGLFDNAITWHFKGISEAEAIKNTEYQYLHKIGLGKNYNLKNEYDKAISLLKKAREDFDDEQAQLTNEALIYLGDAYYAKNDLQLAQTTLEEALERSKASGNLEMELTINIKLGLLAEHNNDFEKAFTYYNESRNRGLQSGFFTIYFEGTIRIGNLFYKEGNYQAANAALSTAYVNAIERENLHYQAQILSVQHKVFSATEDYNNAYAVMTQLANIKSKINTAQQQKVSKELEVQYETLQKEKQILNLTEKQLQKESELQRQKTYKNAFLIGFLIILFPIIALLYTYYQKIQAQSELSRKLEEINIQKVEALRKEQELNLIKASIQGQDEERKRIAQELHDSIGGNLAGIKLQFASMNGDSEKLKNLTGQIDETYQLVRDISHTLIPQKFRQNDFTDLIREYANSISNTGKLEVGFHPHPEKEIKAIDEKHQMEIYKIIQELMTNTLKHADASSVEIHLSLIDNDLSLIFEDNGGGFETNSIMEGIGLENIKNRIKELKGTLHIDSVLERGTVVSIEIPIETTAS